MKTQPDPPKMRHCGGPGSLAASDGTEDTPAFQVETWSHKMEMHNLAMPKVFYGDISLFFLRKVWSY